MKIEEFVQSNLIGSQRRSNLKIVFLDVETAPSIGYTWGKWEQNILDFIEDGYLLSFSLKHAGKNGKFKTRGLPDYAMYSTNPKDDSDLVRDLWEEIHDADVIVAHNGDKFDLPTIYTRFSALGLRPPRPVQTVDTLRVARHQFKFKSNKLDDLCRDLNIGRKLVHTGFDLWKRCMAGDLKAFHLMKRYNQHDVVLLEELYYRWLPYIKNHPNVSTEPGHCPRCGSSKIQFDNYRFTALRKKERYHCLTCRGWFEGSAKKI